MSDTIDKSVLIAAPIERVWDALTDHRQFGAWFGVALDGPFRVGEEARGRMTVPDYDHLVWRATTVAIDPPHHFAFTWHPYAIDPDRDYAAEAPTLVTFRLTPEDGATRVTVVESGFDRVPAARRALALRMNARGWEIQLANLTAHVAR